MIARKVHTGPKEYSKEVVRFGDVVDRPMQVNLKRKHWAGRLEEKPEGERCKVNDSDGTFCGTDCLCYLGIAMLSIEAAPIAAVANYARAIAACTGHALNHAVVTWTTLAYISTLPLSSPPAGSLPAADGRSAAAHGGAWRPAHDACAGWAHAGGQAA